MVRKMNSRVKATCLALLAGGSVAVVGVRTKAKNSGVCPSDAWDTPQMNVHGCNELGSETCTTMEDASVAFKGGPSECVKNDQVTLKLQLMAHTDMDTLYDLSMWVPSGLGSAYDKPFEDAECAVTMFPCQEGGDGDYCGDLLSRIVDGADHRTRGVFGRRLEHEGNATSVWSGDDDSDQSIVNTGYVMYDPVELTIPCRADDDGRLAVPVCLSWDDDDRGSCRNTYDAPTENCRCDVVSIPEVVVSVEGVEGDDAVMHGDGDQAVDGDVGAGGDSGNECTPNGDTCSGLLDDACCKICVEEVLDSGRYVCADGSLGGSHLAGFRGQEFDFIGSDGEYYALFARDDPFALVTMRLEAPVPGLDVITYVVGFGIKAADLNGKIHTIQAFVENPKDFYAHRECPSKNEPCLANGAPTVLLDGEPVTRPGIYELGPGFEVGAVNLPGACRSFDFEKYWARKVREVNEAAAQASGDGGRRRLESWAVPMEEWILGDWMVTDLFECEKYVARGVMEDSLFDFQSEYASFQITTPVMTVRVNHGKVHRKAMRDPTGQFDLPDYRTFQQNIAFERVVLGAHPRGILGETVRPTRDASGKPITHGIESMRGEEEDYRVSGPFADDFSMGLEGRPKGVASAKALGSY